MTQSTQWIIARSAPPTSLLEAMAEHLGLSHKQAKRLLDARQVFVNQRRIWMARHRLRAGDQIEVLGGAPPAPIPAVPVLRECADWLVVNKPAGLLSNGPDSVEAQLRARRGEPELEAVHRLDRDTSGCLLLARRRVARPALVGLFADQAIHKTYLALVQGRFPAAPVLVEQAIEGLSAVTEFRLRKAGAVASLVEARPRTGRTHQIRIHLRQLGHPLAGDRHYATGCMENDVLRRLPRQMLHAGRLAWRDPAAGTEISITAPWPADFARALAQLGLRGQTL